MKRSKKAPGTAARRSSKRVPADSSAVAVAEPVPAVSTALAISEPVPAASSAVAVAEPVPAASAAAAVAEPVTLANLQTAFQGESTAHARYLAFAKAADEEGYAPVASLFRAAARAEEIHAANHGEAIRGLGAEPKADVDAVVVNSTYENLQTAIQGEIYERDEMYPAFLHGARSEGNQAAARTFALAQRVEAEHATLFTQALEQLERMRGVATTYFVCPVCGFTTASDERPRCPVCSTPVERFEKVS